MKKLRGISDKVRSGSVLRRTGHAGKMGGALCAMRSRKGMELVQVGILIAIAIGVGLIFKEQISQFVNNTFTSLLGTSFS